MACIDFDSLTKDNGAIKTLSELLFTTAYEESDLAALVTVKTGQKNGGKLDWLCLSSLVPMGNVATNCGEISWQPFNPLGAEKEWSMGKYEIPISICAESFEETVAEYALNRNTDVDDLEGTEIVREIILPLVDVSLREALMRIVFFGDVDAKTFSNGGQFSNAVSLDFFKITDGFFTKMLAMVGITPALRTTIAANTADDGQGNITYATQLAAIQTDGVATGIMDTLLRSANPRIAANGGLLYMTNRFFQALAEDYERKYHATIPYDAVENGRVITKYRGNTIVVVPEWDRCIDAYQNDGTKWNMPFRVIFTPKENLFVGTTARDVMANVDLRFDAASRRNLLYAKNDIATNFGEDDMVQFAY